MKNYTLTTAFFRHYFVFRSRYNLQNERKYSVMLGNDVALLIDCRAPSTACRRSTDGGASETRRRSHLVSRRPLNNLLSIAISTIFNVKRLRSRVTYGEDPDALVPVASSSRLETGNTATTTCQLSPICLWEAELAGVVLNRL